MKIEKIKTEYGEIKFFRLKDTSFNFEILLPKKKVPLFYLKRNRGYLIMIEGEINTPKGKLKKGDFIGIKPKQKFWMENRSKKKAKYLAIDIPAIKKGDLVFIK